MDKSAQDLQKSLRHENLKILDKTDRIGFRIENHSIWETNKNAQDFVQYVHNGTKPRGSVFEIENRFFKIPPENNQVSINLV